MADHTARLHRIGPRWPSGGGTSAGRIAMQSGYYWVFIPSSDSPRWQVGHYDSEYRTVIVCGQLDTYDVGDVVFGERVIRSVR